MEEVTRPNQVWAIDFMSVRRTGRLRDILNIIDEYSGFLVSFPCSSQKTPQVIRALQTCFSILGVPEAIRSDHGRSLLEARAVKTMCMAWGVKQFKLRIPNIPTKNARVERANQNIRTLLKSLSEQYSATFEEVLPLAAHIFNSTPHNLDSFSPYEIFTGRKVRIDLPTIPNDPIDLRDHITRARRRHQEIQQKVRLMKDRVR